MSLYPPPRKFRLTWRGRFLVLFFIVLLGGGLFGPQILCFRSLDNENALIARGVETLCTLVSTTRRKGGYNVRVAWEAWDPLNGAMKRYEHQEAYRAELFSISALRYVYVAPLLYDPQDPGNAAIMASRNDFIADHEKERRIWAISLSIGEFLMASLTLGAVVSARRNVFLWRSGACAKPEFVGVEPPYKGWAGLKFRFVDSAGAAHSGVLGVREKWIDPTGGLQPERAGAEVFYDPNDANIFALYLPGASPFKIVESR